MGAAAAFLAWGLLAALGDADAPRWPLGGVPPAWWPAVTDLERLHAYGGLAFGGLGAMALVAWALRVRAWAGGLGWCGALALATAAASGLPIGWDGGRALAMPTGIDPALGGVALDALEGLHAAAALVAPLLLLAAVAAAHRGRSGGLRRLAAQLCDDLRTAVARQAARLVAWATRS